MSPSPTTRRGRASARKERLRVAELFAGVGGFRLGLEGLSHPDWPDWSGRDGAGMEVVWSNQWEPATRKQHASRCYIERFGPDGHDCRDIAVVLDELKRDPAVIPEFDVLVGGFPCQDYSVAKTLSQATGINGRKGVLWWEIYRLLEARRPKHLILENVDRLLKSPTSGRGRDFAVMLWCLYSLGYAVEWRIVNAADYGYPQRRRRVFIVGHHLDSFDAGDIEGLLSTDGVLARAFPADFAGTLETRALEEFINMRSGGMRNIQGELEALTDGFPRGHQQSPFSVAGVMRKGEFITAKPDPHIASKSTLGSILRGLEEVPYEYLIAPENLPKWEALKGSKSVEREGRDGFRYRYSEGGVPFPEPLDEPSRTILTGEGGRGPSRFKHVVKQGMLRRRLLPVELELLNGFPPGWTDTGMPDAKRAFMMGNALVVGLVQRIGLALNALVR